MLKARARTDKLPGRFEELVRLMPPQAIADDVQLQNVTDMIDRLMSIEKLTRGQASYLETLVQLVGVYEAEHHAIDTADLGGIDLLRHLLAESRMNASDLAKLLGVHVSMGSKILAGDRKLTADHIRTLVKRFQVDASLFL